MLYWSYYDVRGGPGRAQTRQLIAHTADLVSAPRPAPLAVNVLTFPSLKVSLPLRYERPFCPFHFPLARSVESCEPFDGFLVISTFEKIFLIGSFGPIKCFHRLELSVILASSSPENGLPLEKKEKKVAIR